jgi:hypothetical protein
MVKGTFNLYKDDHALKLLNEFKLETAEPLVQIDEAKKSEKKLEETHA